MNAGLLPALGGGMRALAETGQLSRLLAGYLMPYLRSFERLYYFSYLPESLEEFTEDRALLDGVRVLAPSRATPRGWRALGIARVHAGELRACAVLRVFQVTGVVPALLARARFGVPYVTTYGFWYGRLSRPGPRRLLKRALTRIGLKHAAAVIATTDALRADAARVARRVELIPNGVDTARFVPAPRRTRGTPARILYVGRLSPEKNLASLVRAAAIVNARWPVRLVMVGAGPERERLAAEAKATGVDLELPGVLDHASLAPVYAAADVFSLPSFTEGHPKALLEAMSVALPCVVSECEGNRALVTNGLTGLLFDPSRPPSLAAALERVLDDDALAAALGQAARALVVERYDLSVLVEREIALLHAVGAGTR
jgi:glycosyltransferase involved in cell wall biosynthesis